MARVVEVARPRVVERETDEPVLLARRENLVAERAIERAPHVLRRIEYVRQRQDPRGRHHVVEHGAVDACDGQRADARELERDLLGAELTGVIYAQRELAAELRRELLVDPTNGGHGRIVPGMNIGGRELT